MLVCACRHIVNLACPKCLPCFAPVLQLMLGLNKGRSVKLNLCYHMWLLGSLHHRGIIVECIHMPACVRVSSFVCSECNYWCSNTMQNCFRSGFFSEPNFTVFTVSTLLSQGKQVLQQGFLGLPMDLWHAARFLPGSQKPRFLLLYLSFEGCAVTTIEDDLWRSVQGKKISPQLQYDSLKHIAIEVCMEVMGASWVRLKWGIKLGWKMLEGGAKRGW